jgi:peroxiredoxin
VKRVVPLALFATLAVLAVTVWRSQLFTVQKPGDRPRALAVRDVSKRATAHVDAVLPAVPVGMEHLRDQDGVLVIHYWAPWERDGATQIAALDSLAHLSELAGLRVAVVCFDPFPSVARYVARRRLRVPVLLDTEHALRRTLPCPSVPYTYVLDRAGRIATAQDGEVDWLSEATRAGLRSVLEEPTDISPTRDVPSSAS